MLYLQHYSKGVYGMQKIKMLSITITVGLFLILMGCSNSSDNSDSSQSENQLKVVYVSNNTWDSVFEYLKESFESENEEVEVELVPISGNNEEDQRTKIALMRQSQEKFDVVFQVFSSLKNDIDAGYLQSIDSLREDWSGYDQIVDSLTEPYIADDQLYGLPISATVRGMFYNSNMFDEAGITENSETWDPESWDDIKDAMQQIDENFEEKYPIYYASAKASGEGAVLQSFLMFLSGTDDWIFEDSKWIVESQGLYDSFKWIEDTREYNGTPKVLTNPNGWQTVQYEWMPNEEVGMVLEGAWITNSWVEGSPGECEECQDIYKLAPMPKQNGNGNAGITNTSSLAVSSTAESPELAKEFIKHALTKENSIEIAGILDQVPVREDALESSEFKENTPNADIALNLLESAIYPPSDPNYPTVAMEIQEAMEKITVQGQSAEEVMKEFAINVERTVGEDNVIRKSYNK